METMQIMNCQIPSRSLINNDTVDDDETGELLKDPVAYAENGAASIQARRPTNPQIPITSRLAGLSLTTKNAAGPAPMPSYTSQQVMPPMTHANTMSPVTLGNGGPPVNYQLGSQHYQRHSFPPVNPADQNPPCNTFVGISAFASGPSKTAQCVFVEFEDVSFATKALHELYGHPLHNSIKGGIRLSFSKNPLGVRSGQGMATAGPANASGGMHACTANGPPPGLSAPPGLGLGRMGYAGVMTSGAVGGTPYAANTSFRGSNNWTGQGFTSAMAAGGPTPMMNGSNGVTMWSVISGSFSLLRFNPFDHRGSSRGSRTVLHQVAFYIFCSGVFTIIRFPIRVVAIVEVAAEAGKERVAFGMVLLMNFLFVPFGVFTIFSFFFSLFFFGHLAYFCDFESASWLAYKSSYLSRMIDDLSTTTISLGKRDGSHA
ncbi:hypothetical protein EYC84_008223 [Monilinia fructicola]|uniref:RRM domain-containing protein n=1 Tax=Monilinia fructicola TaxID=38448 RepID=A0A5M9JJ45_MONFR|nr:hypothetical protein EYC84_008223 [Monilinia fructicola]